MSAAGWVGRRAIHLKGLIAAVDLVGDAGDGEGRHGRGDGEALGLSAAQADRAQLERGRPGHAATRAAADSEARPVGREE